MNQTKPWSGGTDEEYEMQHFGFGAQRLKISVRQMVEKTITTWVKEMESYLQDSLDLNETDKVTLARSCDKLIRMYCERAGPSLEVIDDEIERVLRIPSNVLLPEDELQVEQTSDSDFEKLKDEVATLRKRVERGALMDALLTAELEELATVETVCETAKKDMEVIDLLCKSTENDNLKAIQHETQILCASTSFIKKQPDNIFDEATLRKRVERGALMDALLTAELEELATVETVCETAKKDMEVIDLLCKSTENDNLKAIQHETQILCASTSFIKKQPDNIFDD